MVDVETDCERRAGVTFVRVVVTNTRRTAQRVTLAHRIDGAVWPPRRGPTGVPTWTDGTWTGVIEAGRRRGVGFATPAEPLDEPVELVEAVAADGESGPDPLAVLAELDEWTPPSEAVER